MKIYPKIWYPILLFSLLTLAGCGLVVGTAVVGTGVAVGTVGLAGYGVYKGGESVVSSVGSIGASSNQSTKHHQSVVASKGVFKTKSNHSIPALYAAAESTLKSSGFYDVRGQIDGLQAKLLGVTPQGRRIAVQLSLIDAKLTAVQINIEDGTLKQSEYVYDQILSNLSTSQVTSQVTSQEKGVI